MNLFRALSFRSPWMLAFLCLAVPIYFLSLSGGGRVIFSSFRLLPAHGKSWRVRLSFLPPLLLALGAAALALALAGPRLEDRNDRVKKNGIAIMMAVDISGSMQALDLSEPGRERTRLAAVKEVFADFVRGGHGLPGRPDDIIGVVTFARYADTRCPLTLDQDNLMQVASQIEFVSRPEEDGTALGDGLGLALERLRESRAKSRVVILLTDGVSNTGETAPLQAAELAKKIGVKVYTVGAGTNGMAPIRVQDAFGRSFLQRMPVEIDEKSLKEIAEKTGGRYFRATDAEALKHAYQEIDTLERSEFAEQRYRQYRELYPYATGLALILLSLGWLLSGTLFRRLP